MTVTPSAISADPMTRYLNRREPIAWTIPLAPLGVDGDTYIFDLPGRGEIRLSWSSLNQPDVLVGLCGEDWLRANVPREELVYDPHELKVVKKNTGFFPLIAAHFLASTCVETQTAGSKATSYHFEATWSFYLPPLSRFFRICNWFREWRL